MNRYAVELLLSNKSVRPMSLHTMFCCRRLPLVAAAVLLLCASTASAQPVDSLVSSAIRSHPGIESARLAVQQSDARSRSAAAWEPPSIGLQFDMLPPDNPNPFSSGETMLMAEQMIPLGDAPAQMARAMALGSESRRLEVVTLERDIRSRIEQVYYRLWLLERRAQLNRESARLVRLMHRTAENAYASGGGGGADIYRVAIEIERLAADSVEIVLDLDAARSRLNLLAGRLPATPIELPAELPSGPIPETDSAITRLAGNPELLAMGSMAVMARAEAEAELGMLAPMLMLRGGIAYMPQGHPLRESSATGHGVTMSDGPMRFALSAGAMISIPLAPWSRSGPEGRAEGLRLEAERSLLARESMRLEMESMLRNEIAAARRARERLQFHTNRQIPLLKKSLESLQARYSTGSATLGSLVDASMMLVMARMDAAMQQMELAMALSMIRRMVGE